MHVQNVLMPSTARSSRSAIAAVRCTTSRVMSSFIFITLAASDRFFCGSLSLSALDATTAALIRLLPLPAIAAVTARSVMRAFRRLSPPTSEIGG